MNEKDVAYFQNKLILNFGHELEKYKPDLDLPYILFGSFALFVSELIKNKKESELLKKANLLIEEMAESENIDVNNLFNVGFLEVLADEDSSIEYVRKHSSKRVNDALNGIMDHLRWKK